MNHDEEFEDWFSKSGYDPRFKLIMQVAWRAGVAYQAQLEAELRAGEDI